MTRRPFVPAHRRGRDPWAKAIRAPRIPPPPRKDTDQAAQVEAADRLVDEILQEEP